MVIQTGYESELKNSLVFDLNYPPVTIRKSRHELSEEEKEERRLRRVLANREAAKRTVRRRQAMREELRTKAADLALENENLKKTKELAAAEYNSLKDKNNNLRMQIARTVKAEEEETYGDSKSPSSSLTFLHDQSPKMPLILSAVVPRFDGLIVQSGPQGIPGIIQQMPNASLGEFKPYDKLESSVMMNTPGTPLCIVSFPWQMQFHAQSYPFHRWPSYPNDHCKTECSTSTPKATVNMENILESTPLKVKTETPGSIDAMTRNFLHNADRYFRPDEGGQLTGLFSKGMVHTTSTSSPFVLPVIARQNHEITQHKVTYSAVGHVAGEPAEMHQEHATCSNNASAEARRKWRELMK